MSLSAVTRSGLTPPPWIAEAGALVRALEAGDAHDGKALREVRAAEMAIVEAHYEGLRRAAAERGVSHP